MSGAVKVLVCGDVNGKFVQVIKRVSTVNQKSGPFDMLLCVGEFFGPDDEDNEKVMNGLVEFPIPTYILAFYPDESAEFSSNVTYLGRKGILNTASGLQIAYLSGIEGKTANPCQFTAEDVQSGFLGVDILLTGMWPAEVNFSSEPTREVEGSVQLSRLAAGLKPRYHFAGHGEMHYERSPYRNHRVLLEPAQHVTRFIGLASVENSVKEKWLYAFSVVPLKKLQRSELTLQPPNVSEFPYWDLLEQLNKQEAAVHAAATTKKQAGEKGQYFFDMSEEPEDNVDHGGKKRRRDREEYQAEKRQPQQPCWFCLSNVDAEKHLVVSVGNNCYAAMPKGPLVDDHVLVLSIGHIQSLVAAPDEVRTEVEKYKQAFTLAADKEGRAVVAFERNWRTAHLQLQIVPVPKTCSKALRGAFMNAAQLKNIELTQIGPGEQISELVNPGCPYFYVELPDGSRLFTTSMKNFPLQFAREVLASEALLNCEDKVDWRACVKTKEEETDMAQTLAKRFRAFDFTDDGNSD